MKTSKTTLQSDHFQAWLLSYMAWSSLNLSVQRGWMFYH